VRRRVISSLISPCCDADDASSYKRFFVHRQVFQQFADALVEVLKNFRTRLLRQFFNPRHCRFDITNPRRKIVVQAAALARALRVQRLQRADQRFLSKLEGSARVVLLLDDVKKSPADSGSIQFPGCR